MKIRHSISSALGILSLIQKAQAWGNLGHQTIAYTAQNFVTTATEDYCRALLNDQSESYLATIATWADTYRYTSEGSFSAPFHFIDANDAPPQSCGVDFDRDCGETGCVVSAVNNYTKIILAEEDLTALKFIVHFIGDLHQPLHDEAIEIGGNRISVTFNDKSSNLHHIWDTEMLEKRAGGTTIAVAKKYSATLTDAITQGAYQSAKASWLTGIDIADPIASTMTWVTEANSFVCSAVLDKGLTYVEDTDLSGAYYDAALPVFEEQLAKAGYRLAAWLNLIATGSTGL